jgi:hypothetical protein
LHGDDAHQAWLKKAGECFIARAAIPAAPKTQSLDAAFVEVARAQLRREKFEQIQKLARQKVAS